MDLRRVLVWAAVVIGGAGTVAGVAIYNAVQNIGHGVGVGIKIAAASAAVPVVFIKPEPELVRGVNRAAKTDKLGYGYVATPTGWMPVENKDRCSDCADPNHEPPPAPDERVVFNTKYHKN